MRHFARSLELLICSRGTLIVFLSAAAAVDKLRACLPARSCDIVTDARTFFALFQIRPRDVDQLFGRVSAFRVGFVCRIDDVQPDVICYDLGNEAIDGTTGDGDEVQHIGTTSWLFKRAFNRFDLSANASRVNEQFGLLLSSVGHVSLRDPSA
jgi:hypothetical protein